jgi:18S rRNA (guanine1575-N7)-methyltransferase
MHIGKACFFHSFIYLPFISSRMLEIQTVMTERALELLGLQHPEETDEEVNSMLLLDIGCGSGISGDVLTEYGHAWIGLDISESMLSNDTNCFL